MQSSLAITPACSNSASDGVSPRSSSSPRVRSIVVRPTAAQGDARVGDLAAVDPQRGARRRDRPVTRAPLDLLVGAARAGADLEADLGEDLAVLHGGRPRVRGGTRPSARVRVPSAPRIVTVPLSAAQTADRSSAASAWQSEPPIVPRLRTTGSAITSSASRKTGNLLGEQLGLEQLDVAGERADRDLVALLADVLQLREVVDVDQPRRLREPQLHHRQQRVPAGDDPRVLVLAQRGERAVQARRPLVLKRCWGLHLRPRIGRGRWCR